MIHFIIIIFSYYSVVECLNVTKIDTETVLLSWTQDSVPDNATVEIVFKVVGDRYHTVLPVSDLHVGDNFALIENLSAYTNYQVQVRSDDDEDASEVVFFSTSVRLPDSGSDRVDLCILVVLMLLWCLVLVMFFKRWGKIRDLIPYQPYQPSSYIKEISDKLERIHSDRSTKHRHCALNMNSQIEQCCSRCLHKESMLSRGRPRQDTTNSSVLLEIVQEMKQQQMRRAKSAVDMIHNINNCKDFSRQYSNSEQTLDKPSRKN